MDEEPPDAVVRWFYSGSLYETNETVPASIPDRDPGAMSTMTATTGGPHAGVLTASGSPVAAGSIGSSGAAANGAARTYRQKTYARGSARPEEESCR
jgi:hypothetical protein